MTASFTEQMLTIYTAIGMLSSEELFALRSLERGRVKTDLLIANFKGELR